MKILNQKGLSLVQVLMSAGLIGGLGIVASQLTTNMNRGMKNAESSSDVLSVMQGIQRSLAVPENCTQTFLGKNPVNAPNVVSAIQDKSSGSFVQNFKTVALDPNLHYGQGQLRIKTYSLSDASDTVDVATLRTTELIIQFDKGKNGFTQDATKKIVLKVELDGSSNISSCVAASNANDGIWKWATNNLDIFFNSGFIGIGTLTPTTALDVVGDVRSVTTPGGGIMIQAGTGSPTDPGDFIFKNNDGTVRAVIQSGNGASGELHFDLGGVPGDSMLIDAAGNTTLYGAAQINGGATINGPTTVNNTLTVNGTVNPINSISVGGGCSPAGAMAYSTAANSPVYCNNSGVWAQVGGGSESIDIYQCPHLIGCTDGQVISGDWASYGCQGQVSSQTTCQNNWFNGGFRSCNNACTALGKVRVTLP